MTDGEASYERNEDEGERLDRQWTELMGELRLAQTGTQILFAFLLAIAFQPVFRQADEFTHDVYAATLVISALAVGLFLAPVSFHRIVYGRRLRDRMLPIAARMAYAGLVLLVLSMAGGILLALDAVLNRTVAFVVVAVVLVWFTVFWYAIPAWVRTHGDGESPR
jgi:hypothetical protein